MSVSSHLNIPLAEYDARIRTFIPRYEAMLDAAAGVLGSLDVPSPTIVDLGIGTGALAGRCLTVRPDARIIGVDEDAGILDMARRRLSARAAQVSFVHGSFDEVALPRCSAIVASLSLHHVRAAGRKRALYASAAAALDPRGFLINADCMPASDPALAEAGQRAWRAHLGRAYSETEVAGYFAAWAEEDVYFTLDEELSMLKCAGFSTDVVWREGVFAVVAARRP
jgi:tRNA (cmo5U34)-methyltransferase